MISQLLKEDYPVVVTPLKHESAFQLLAATLISAQTLDETVNQVTPLLFARFPDPESLASASWEEVDQIIMKVNYHKTKARNLIKMAQKIVSEFLGQVPCEIEKLITLPGVGRKTANVLISEWFAKPLNTRGNRFGVKQSFQKHVNEAFVNPKNFKKGDEKECLPQGFVVDTHVARVSKRLGLTFNEDPVKIEKDLMNIFPRNEWPEISLRMIFHGRYRCKAKSNLCHMSEKWRELCIG